MVGAVEIIGQAVLYRMQNRSAYLDPNSLDIKFSSDGSLFAHSTFGLMSDFLRNWCTSEINLYQGSTKAGPISGFTFNNLKRISVSNVTYQI